LYVNREGRTNSIAFRPLREQVIGDGAAIRNAWFGFLEACDGVVYHRVEMESYSTFIQPIKARRILPFCAGKRDKRERESHNTYSIIIDGGKDSSGRGTEGFALWGIDGVLAMRRLQRMRCRWM